MSAYLDGRPSEPRSVTRFLFFGLIVGVSATVLSLRLFSLQVTSGGQLQAVANANRTVQEAIPSTRGLIYDRNGQLLVSNVASYSVKIRPADLPESKRDGVVNALAGLIGMNPADINVAIDSNPGSRFDLVRVASDVPSDVASFIAENSDALPGVQIVVETRRDYLYGPLLSQVLGYEGPINSTELASLSAQGYQPDDLIGRTGVEATYEPQLRGTYGEQTVERDATGRRLDVLSVDQQPVAGDSLQLTIDLHEQELATKALQWGIKAAGLKGGVIIVMNPQDGEILAMASLPTYDDNQFAQGISTKDYQALLNNPYKPLVNHAISEQYPPGSTFKLVTGSAGLADGKITPSTLIHTAGFLTLGGAKFHDWNPNGFGLCNLYCGFGNSSDTYFYQVAARVGIDRLSYWAHQFGFAQKTGIDLPSEAVGTIPSNAWKLENLGTPIYPGETYLAGIGQGYDAVTPIELLDAYGALANGGKLYAPRVVKDVLGPDGNVVVPFQPVLTSTVAVPKNDLMVMRRAARYGIVIRHTYNLVDMPIVVAGKSGTAQFGIPDSRGVLPYHSWFAAFVPKDPWKTASDPNGYKAVERTDSPLEVLAFAYDSQTKGNAAVEIVKYYLQLHFNIHHDYRLPNLLRKGNFYVLN
ncbi:MAG TPA: penicillin-binding protein 2 [Candidatus Limnocylindrales bacterium]|nr:penicillin-binding protein 2 [Candidatus Limnocylindrales bacterium]